MGERKHSPLPWKVVRIENAPGLCRWIETEGSFQDYYKNGKPKGKPGPIRIVAGMQFLSTRDADFIVRAANNHDALVSMLERLEYGGDDGDGEPQCPLCCAGYGMAHKPDCELAALLKRAKGA